VTFLPSRNRFALLGLLLNTLSIQLLRYSLLKPSVRLARSPDDPLDDPKEESRSVGILPATLASGQNNTIPADCADWPLGIWQNLEVVLCHG
jgi:hypothetical protein